MPLGTHGRYPGPRRCPVARADGYGIGAVAAGAVFLWAGVKGYSIPQTLRDIITGKSPLKQPQATGISGDVSGTSASTTAGVLGVSSSALPSSGTYTTAQLQALWQQAGGSASTAQNAACHAMQESGGNPRITSPNPDGGTNVGIFQLDTKGVGSGYTVAELQNALNNARITVFATANGTNWSKWSTPGC